MLKTAVCWWWLWICEGGKLDCRSGTRRLGRGAFAAVLEPFSKHSSLIDQLADTYQDLQLRASAIQSCGGVFVRDKQKIGRKAKEVFVPALRQLCTRPFAICCSSAAAHASCRLN